MYIQGEDDYSFNPFNNDGCDSYNESGTGTEDDDNDSYNLSTQEAEKKALQHNGKDGIGKQFTCNQQNHQKFHLHLFFFFN